MVTSREESLQKRIHQLDSELLDAKEELRKQTSLAQCRRTKDAADLGLWDKQKRFQQLSENLKLKLSDREMELDKLKANFGTAKNTIARLEREKHLLDSRLRGNSNVVRYCQSASCPNVHGSKYTPAETPESYVSNSDGDGSVINEPAGSKNSARRLEVNDSNHELIDALKARIETQQRKIVAMELDGKGNTAVSVEFEKAHERLSSIEAQNLRLEAKNLQLQLDNDMLRQGDHAERTKRQIKHLEE